MGNYLKNLALGFDQFVNTLCNGYPDETLSSRAYMWGMNGVRAWPRKVIDALFFWKREHCLAAYVAEVLRRQAPPDCTAEQLKVWKAQQAKQD